MLKITPQKLYNYITCPHRVWRDEFGPRDEMIEETNPFVKMLWEKGVQFEEHVISSIGEYFDASEGSFDQRYAKTITAMGDKTDIIYQGVIKADDLLGIPDLLVRHKNEYIPVDIKSGCAFEGGTIDTEGKYKKTYAVQLCVYADILMRLGYLNAKMGKIIDVRENEVIYDFNSSIGKNTPISWWEFYLSIKKEVSDILLNKVENLPARGGSCKLCPWYLSCKNWCIEKDDLTNIFYLGRSKRDVLVEDLGISTVMDFKDIDLFDVLDQKKQDKSFLKGVGEKTLNSLIKRAKIIKETNKPELYESINLPSVDYELFFDIEADPTRDFVYLHGVWERSPEGERFVYFLTDEIDENSEKQAWANFWKYIDSLPKDNFAVYYYSPYEKTSYKRLASFYPDVRSIEQVEEFYANPNVIDLYTSIIAKKTDWPLPSYSIKEIAVYLGFKWRDESPSGAASIQWFNEYVNTKDKGIMQRILDYNEDDCKATLVVKDGLVALNDKK